MKIDRILFCLNNNPTYINFWNINSKIWKLKYNIKPTLLYIGAKEEIKKLNLLEEHGEIIVLPKIDEDLCNGSLRQWYITWALFFGASLFENEVCMTSGIDQIPLSNIFLEKISDIEQNKYIIGFADAYGRKDLFPSSHHVAKGKYFKNKYEILNNWHEEVYKVYSHKNKYNFLYEGYWGLDEAYSSEMLLKNNDNIHYINNFFHPLWTKKRIDRDHGLKYDIKLLSNGWYSELHSPRPYELYSQQIDNIIFSAHGI